PEWSRFVMIVKEQHKLDEVSYHKLFDILKQYQKEVNELYAKRLARNANPLVLVATAQVNQDPYYQTSKSHKPYVPSAKPLISTRSHTTTRSKGKEIAKPITPPFESASEEDNDPEQAQRDKDMQKNLALIAKNPKSQKGLKTLHKDEEIDEQQLEARYSYMTKIQEVPTVDLGTDSEPLEQVQNDTGYNVFANELQHSEQSESISNTCLVETDDSNVILESPDMCDDDIQNDQNDVESDDERVVLANLIANLKIDVDEKKYSKAIKESKHNTCSGIEINNQTEFEKYKAFNDHTVYYEKLKLVKEKHDELIKQSLLTKSHYEGLVKQKTKVITDLKLKEEHDIDKMLSLEKQLKFLIEIVFKRNQSIQTIHMMAPKDMDILIKTCLMPLALKTQNDSFIFIHEVKQEMHDDLKYVESLEKEIYELEYDKAEFLNMYDMILQECKPDPFSDSLERKYFSKTKSFPKTNVSEGLSKIVTAQTLPQTARQAVSNTNVLKPGLYRIDTGTTQTKAPQSPQTFRNTNPRVSNSTGVNHKTNVSRPHHRSNQMKDKVVPNNSQVKLKKTQVEDHPSIPIISNKINKKPNVVPISTRKPKGHANKSAATPHKKKVASKSTTQKPKSYYRMLYEKTSKAWKWWIEQLPIRIVQLILFIVDSGCMKHMTGNLKLLCNFVEKYLGTVRFGNDQFASILGYGDLVQGNITIKRFYYVEGLNHNLFSLGQFCDADLEHMTGNLKLLCNFVEKYLGTVRFGNDQFASILGYGDLVQGNITIKRFYYVEGLNHNLFSLGQFCDADLEVAFRKSTCFVRDLQGNNLLTGNRRSDLYTISLQESTSSTPLCLMAKASPTQAWLWHRRISHLNFDYINLLSKKDVVIGLLKIKYIKDQLCSSCEVSKAKRNSFKSKSVPSLTGRLNLLHMDLCGPMRVASINLKKYILIIIDDYSRFTCTLFLHSKDETPEILK
nr:retrovirus-related Pol polyprotein from transposon TNT 1-94 [Tanacetum cinerariifolium]